MTNCQFSERGHVAHRTGGANGRKANAHVLSAYFVYACYHLSLRQRSGDYVGFRFFWHTFVDKFLLLVCSALSAGRSFARSVGLVASSAAAAGVSFESVHDEGIIVYAPLLSLSRCRPSAICRYTPHAPERREVWLTHARCIGSARWHDGTRGRIRPWCIRDNQRFSVLTLGAGRCRRRRRCDQSAFAWHNRVLNGWANNPSNTMTQ